MPKAVDNERRMLRYLALGQRNFGLHPMTPARRVDWEFYVILRGPAAPIFHEHERPPLRTRTLWVLGPESRHGWIGDKRQPCQIAAFQFAFLPAPLCDLVTPRGALAVPLTAAQVREIEGYARELQPHFAQPTSFSEIVAHRVMLQLSLVALAGREPVRLKPLHRAAQLKVAQAIEWYEHRLPERPSLKLVAEAIHVSPSYLRRLFWEVKKQRPKAVLRALQMERVVQRLTASASRLDEIAADCGFATASELCRAFKARFKLPPSLWRKNQLPLYQEPKATRGAAAVARPDTPTHRKLKKYIRFT